MTGILQEDGLRQVPGSRVRVPVCPGSPELVPCRQRRRAKAPLTWLQQEPLTFGIFKWQLGETTLAVRPINLLLEGAHFGLGRGSEASLFVDRDREAERGETPLQLAYCVAVRAGPEDRSIGQLGSGWRSGAAESAARVVK